jgi:hypothetical protein
MFLERIVASCSYGCVQLDVCYVTLSAFNKPVGGLEGKGDRLASVMPLAVIGVNQFKLMCSGVHSSSRVFDPLQCFVYAFIYGHITIRDQGNVVNIERLSFSLKKKGATK